MASINEEKTEEECMAYQRGFMACAQNDYNWKDSNKKQILDWLHREGYIEEATSESYNGVWNWDTKSYDVKCGAANCPQIQIRNGRPPKSEQECLIAVIEALVLQGGVNAWSGDGTSCVAQMIWAMHKRAEKAEAELEKLKNEKP